MKLILVNWLPATGKTTLAKKISKDLRIPYYIKDDFKEILYDKVGYETPEEKVQFEITALHNIYYILERHLEQKISVILEANFYSERSSPVISKLLEKYDCEVFQIKCICDWDILYERFLERASQWSRHPWHWELSDDVKLKWKEYYKKWTWKKLEIDWKYIEVDTQYFSKIDYPSLYKKLI